MMATRAQVASIFGVTPTAIDGWIRRGCPVAERSQGRGRGKGAKFWMPDVVHWRDRNVVARDRADTPEGETTKDLARRLLRAQTEDAELDLAKKRGELMEVTEYHDVVAGAFERVGARLKSIAPRLAVAAIGVGTLPEGLARMEPLVHELLRELADGEDVPLGEDDADPATTPAAWDPTQYGMLDVEATPAA